MSFAFVPCSQKSWLLVLQTVRREYSGGLLPFHVQAISLVEGKAVRHMFKVDGIWALRRLALRKKISAVPLNA